MDQNRWLPLIAAVLTLLLFGSMYGVFWRYSSELEAQRSLVRHDAADLTLSLMRSAVRLQIALERLQEEQPEGMVELRTLADELGNSLQAMQRDLRDESYHELPGAAEIIEDVDHWLQGFKPLAALPRVDADLLRARFGPPLDQMIGRMAAQQRLALEAQRASIEEKQQAISHINRFAVVLLSVALVCGGLLVALLLRQQRRLEQMRDALGDRVAARTADLQASTERVTVLMQAVEQSPNAVLIADADGFIRFVNPRFTAMSGYSPEAIIGARLGRLPSDRIESGQVAEMWNALAEGRVWHAEIESCRSDGNKFWESVQVAPLRDERGLITHYVLTREDVSERRVYEARMLRRAQYDELTGLPNRVLAMQRLGEAIERADRDDGSVTALLFVSMDGLQRVNFSYGHAAGDHMLAAAGERLLELIGRYDLVSRFGGDEFLIMLVRRKGLDEVTGFLRRLVDAFHQPLVSGDQQVHTTVSVGAALYPLDGREADILLRCADTARNRAKAEGRDRFRLYDEAMRERMLESAQIEELLHGALDRGEFSVVYQPVIELASGRPVGAEALLRWSNPTLGVVSPDRFVQVAEETGLIVDIGAWVLDTACRELGEWREQFGPYLHMAVNVSARQFDDAGFVDMVRSKLRRQKIPGEALMLELTERLFLDKDMHALDVMNTLNREGVRLAIDDFGTGYSSLSYLRRFPVRTLKIDKSFLTGVPEETEVTELVSAIVAMARALELSVICEGIETQEQMHFIKSIGTGFGQGYHFAKPMPSTQIRAYFAGVGVGARLGV